MNSSQPSTSSLIDELRKIRRGVTDEFGDDVSRLCDHLREVEQEYISRSGRFANLFVKSAAQVVAGWGDEINDLRDPLIDEMRAIRAKLKDPSR